MQTAGASLDPSVSLTAAVPADAALRVAYFEIDAKLTERSEYEAGAAAPSRHQHAEWLRWARATVSKSARLLEFIHVAATAWELLSVPGAPSIENYGYEKLRADVIDRCSLDPVSVVEGVRDFIPPVEDLPATTALPSTEIVVRAIGSIVNSCPENRLRELALAAGLGLKWHRAEVALRCLRIFLLKNDLDSQRRVDMLGELYQLGRLDIPYIAEFLNASIGDTVSILEDRGFARSLDVVALPTAERSAKLRSIRRDRIQREDGSVAHAFPEYVDRAVIASERIEGIDARPWLIRTAPRVAR